MKSESFSTDELLLHKVLTPLPESEISKIGEIAQLDVTDFVEADVREEVISCAAFSVSLSILRDQIPLLFRINGIRGRDQR